MSGQLRFDGQVAVITGAGGGLGREYALMLGARGAAVVVNDLGSSRDGEGRSKTADAVVQQIRDNGGKAAPNYDSVEEGHRIVETAIREFGRIDILVNNAGFLRDRSVLKMADLDWDLIHRVHLRGAFVTTRAAWPHFKKQGYGRVLFTSSAAGLFGNFGQANYSAAKMGLVGLGKTLALEGQKYNIACNVLVPAAASRLTEEVFPPEFMELMGAALVAPVAVALCHQSCPANGAVVEAAGGAAATYRWQRSTGIADSQLTPEKVLEQWERVDDHSLPLYPDSPAAQMSLIAQLVTDSLDEERRRKEEEQLPSDVIDVARALKVKLPAATFTYTPKDAVLYALGIGVTLSEPLGLRFLYESHEHFTVHPMFPGLFINVVDMTRLASLPGFPMDLSQLLHGEQYMELRRPLPPAATLNVDVSISDIVDKGDKGALVLLDVRASDQSGEELAYVQTTIFLRGHGNFGGKSRSEHTTPCGEIPSRPADHTLTYTTGSDQAALYRLSGDMNPLHIDPEFAALGGQKQPILHGLCALGASVHAILGHYAPDDPNRLCRVKARFSRPVLPGQTLLVDTWHERGSRRVLFQSRVKETGQTAVTGGYVEFRETSASTDRSRL